MRNESYYYSRVSRFLEEEYGCFVTGKSTGCRHAGLADVVGIRDVGGPTMPDVETIAVEVKKSGRNFAKSLGQALGYSYGRNLTPSFNTIIQYPSL